MASSGGLELPPDVLALVARSLVLHTGTERPIHAELASALSVLPYSCAEAVRLLAPLAAAVAGRPPFTLDMGAAVAPLLFLTPMLGGWRLGHRRPALPGRRHDHGGGGRAAEVCRGSVPAG